MVCLEDFAGDSNAYIEHLFSIFKTDFIESSPSYNNKRILFDNRMLEQDKPEGFLHIVTEKDNLTGQRTNTDLRRCERLCWIRPVIENFTDDAIDYWEKEDRGKIKTKFLLRDMDFVVILSSRKNSCYYLVTSYYLDWPNSKRKILKERDLYIKQKPPQ